MITNRDLLIATLPVLVGAGLYTYTAGPDRRLKGALYGAGEGASYALGSMLGKSTYDVMSDTQGSPVRILPGVGAGLTANLIYRKLMKDYYDSTFK